MPITTANINLMKKLLLRTRDENDGEVLNAIRLANATLDRMEVTWDDVLAGAAAIDVEEDTETRDIDRAFKVLEDVEHEFIDSLRRQWNSSRMLTPRQREALFKWANRKEGIS